MLNLADPGLIISRTGPLYLDPGSGSMLLQALLGAILAVGIGVRLFWSRIKSLSGNEKKSDEGPKATE